MWWRVSALHSCLWGDHVLLCGWTTSGLSVSQFTDAAMSIRVRLWLASLFPGLLRLCPGVEQPGRAGALSSCPSHGLHLLVCVSALLRPALPLAQPSAGGA